MADAGGGKWVALVGALRAVKDNAQEVEETAGHLHNKVVETVVMVVTF